MPRNTQQRQYRNGMCDLLDTEDVRVGSRNGRGAPAVEAVEALGPRTRTQRGGVERRHKSQGGAPTAVSEKDSRKAAILLLRHTSRACIVSKSFKRELFFSVPAFNNAAGSHFPAVSRGSATGSGARSGGGAFCKRCEVDALGVGGAAVLGCKTRIKEIG